MRSLLFSPGDDRHKIDKAFASDADAVIFDLEDSVAPDNKAAARDITLAALMEHSDNENLPQIYVRINALPTGLADDDLSAVVQAKPHGIMFPKSNGAQDLATLASMLAPLEDQAGIVKPLGVIVLATETAQSLFTMGTYVEADPRLEALTWGAEDLSAELGAVTNKDENGIHTDPYRLARTLCLAGARAAGVTPIDTVYVNYKDSEGFRTECETAVRDGFTAKLAIHPAQVPIINEVFTPSNDDIVRAEKIISAFAQADNAGVIGLDGEMLDQPHLIRAQDLLKRAKAYGPA